MRNARGMDGASNAGRGRYWLIRVASEISISPRQRRVVRSSRLVAGISLWLLTAAALLCAGPSLAQATSSFYWYGENNSTCWQTGQLGSPSTACGEAVGPGFLSKSGSLKGGLAHMDEVSAGGSAEGIQLPDGNYCNYYKIGDDISREEPNNQGGVTGYTPPTPYRSYQESDPYGNVCQADGATWGQEVGTGDPSNNCYNTCGMHHIVSLHELSDYPWASWFGEPSLAVSAEALVHTVTFSGESAYNMAWGYVCPLLEDTTTGHILEYCFEEWRSVYNPPKWKEERIGTCGPNGYNTVVTYFWPGTKLSTEQGGSANTFEFSGTPSGWTPFAAAITKTNLLTAIDLAKEPPTENGCGTNFSPNPEKYALVGVEQGIEGEHKLSGIGSAGRNLQVRTEYTPLPPEASTSAASEIQQTQAKLNGTVNPRGISTHDYFEYGKTTGYGSSTSSSAAGSGLSPVGEGATAIGLEPGTVYHYRLVATNEVGTVRGSDQSFTTPVPTIAFQANTDKLWTDLPASESGSGWLNTTLGMKPGTSSSIAVLPEGKYEIAFQANNSELWTYSSNGEYHKTTLGMKEATTPSITALPESKYEIAFQANNSELWTYSSNGEYHNTTLGMKEKTSPSITTLSNGGYAVAFQANNGELWTYSSNGEYHNTTLGMKEKTSPSITTLSNGGYAVAFQANNGELWTYSSNGEYHNTTLGMKEKTSPSIIALPEGKYEIAFQANNSELWTYSSNGEYHKTTLGMKEKTSPSITTLSNGGYAVAFQANNGELWTYSSNGEYHNTTLGIKEATTPSITALPEGKYEIAFQANNSELWTYSPPSSGDWLNTTLGMKEATSPSITALSNGSYTVAFQANNGELWTYSSNGEYHNTTLGMKEKTSPSITALPESKYEIAFQANNSELWTYSSNGEYHKTTLGMKEATTPSITALPESKYEIAFQANNSELWTYSSNGEYHKTTLGMKEKTSPSITTLSNGGYAVAFQANNGELWTYSSNGEYHKTTLGMKEKTSPSIIALPEGKYEIAFQANNGELWTYSSNGEYHSATLGMMPGTSPSIAARPNSDGKYEVAFQASNGELWTYASTGEYSNTALGIKEGTSPSVEE